MELYNITYLLSNLFMIYVSYEYMHIFYSVCRVSLRMEILCYIGYTAISSLVFFSLRIPLAMLLTNISLMLLLTLLYEDGSFKKSVLAVTFIYIAMMLSELLMADLSSRAFQPTMPFYNQSLFNLVSARLLSYVFLLFIKGCKKSHGNFPLPVSYWISLLVIPIGSAVMLHGVYMSEKLPHSFQILCLICTLLVNLLAFYLYDTLSGLMQAQMEQRILEEKNRFYEYQVQMMKDNLDNMRIYRHDLNNRLAPLYALASSGQNDELLAHLSKLSDGFSQSRDYACSGNITADSIINYKMQNAEKKHIRISTDLLIPDQLTIPTFDLAVILGNLLDNALEATENVDDRWIDIVMKYSKGRLMIDISNSYDGTVLLTETGIATRKKDKENHGIGLKSVETALRKYDGLLQVSNDENRFRVKALLYL